MSWDNLAILIPTRDRPSILARTLAELARVGLGKVPLWVYDDASEDSGPIRRLVNEWSGGTLISGDARVGQAQGRNRLLRNCGKEFALLLDDDNFPASASGLESHLRKDPTTSRRAIVTFQNRSLADGRLSTPPAVTAGPATFFLAGGSLLHVPSVLKVGGFRSCFVYGYEEPELAMRLWLNGFEIWYDPSIVVEHNQFYTPEERRDYREYDYLYARNSILFSSLNMPLWMGLPHGLARSFRVLFSRRRNFGTKLHGTLAGLWLSFYLWTQRTPCSRSQAIEWCRLVKR